MLYARNERDTKKLTDEYREKESIRPVREQPRPMLITELDVGVAVGQIAARSGDILGTGDVESKMRIDGDNAPSFLQYEDVNNPYGSSIAADTWVVIGKTLTNKWIIVGADCP